MERLMKAVASVSVAMTILFVFLYAYTGNFLSLAITAGTIAYHY